MAFGLNILPIFGQTSGIGLKSIFFSFDKNILGVNNLGLVCDGLTLPQECFKITLGKSAFLSSELAPSFWFSCASVLLPQQPAVGKEAGYAAALTAGARLS